jgi:hypothetical protein
MMNRLSLQGAGTVVLATLAASALALGGCTTDRQIGGNGGSGGSSTQTSTSTGGTTTGTTGGGGGDGGGTTGGGGAGGGQAGSSIALLNSQITQVSTTDKNGWLDAGETLDPTTLIVVVSSEPQSCSAPVFDFTSLPHQLVLIGLPQAMQKVGKYDLSTTDVIAYGSFWVGDGMGNGGGVNAVLNQGTVEVLSIDSTTINVRLEGLSKDFPDANGDHLAARCP